MVFSSLLFVFLFLALNLVCYYSVKTIRQKNIVLLVFSLIFYAWGGAAYLLLLAGMAFWSWLCALMIEKKQNKKSKKQNMDINYLDLIPETNQSIRWHRDLKQRIILEIENKGMFNTIAQKVFGKPRFSKVHLDEMGTFIWPEIDGTKTVQDLALLVKEHFGDKAEPLYPRIVKYFQIMESYEFVHFINKKTEK